MTYGVIAACVASGFGANTLNVAQHPSTFSTLNTDEHVTPAVPQGSSVLVVGIDHATPFPQHVYSMIGRVLHRTVVVPHPKKPRSHVSKQVLGHSALFCRMLITVKISEMQQVSSF